MISAIFWTCVPVVMLILLLLFKKLPNDEVCPRCGKNVRMTSFVGGGVEEHMGQQRWNGVLTEKECECKGG